MTRRLVLHRDEPGYPPRLRAQRGAPRDLWVEGDPVALCARTAVAIVGTRRLSPYGERVARELAWEVASAGAVVVSGLAQGIDSAAHRGALAAGGLTVAVLGEGLDAFWSTAAGTRRPLAERIVTTGTLVSEFAPRCAARTWTFVRRNATIAALSDAVVVVEAGYRSGALITAAEAAGAHRPLYAVPGPIGAPTSRGTNALIASGVARALWGAEDLVRALGLTDTRRAVAPADPLGGEILYVLAAGALDPDALARRIGRSPEEIGGPLAALVMRGAVRSTGDGRFERESQPSGIRYLSGSAPSGAWCPT